ncbi:katanin p80 WD40-containing subunit B1 isoform 1 [Planoprotostelium fungivorum]|uniref:Katanin p80 WD40 repeat-containing subunit B1 homolog n=1 Tax=Planoprotostelium fungivorum TaxID=1890364 RepID=A0A2P6NPW5_9EUKA|nr:katanin p80 WD40-containing subunit B1 isoform 1 [Planoprotostelium fungivorum]
MAKRVFQLQEFAAHGGNVNSLRIGRKSGRVMVTGGDDKLVNMWAIGKQQVIMSLEGHTHAVDSVCFDTAEELVVAGSSAGTIKLWDLDKQQVVRTLNGSHKSSCCAVDFHPFGEFFASGSADTDLKIWDIRRRGCIQTYKGHKQPISIIRFSPDGRWVISGGQDGLIKLWDLTAGRPLREFKDHTGSIKSLEFHPHEFLLASGSADRTVKFWDLESFEMISSSDSQSSSVGSVIFHPDGTALLSAYEDSLKVWGYEPSRLYDNVSVPWNNVHDINITADQLIGCAMTASNVSVWVVDVFKLRPFSKESNVFDPPPTNVRTSQNFNKTAEALKLLSIGGSNREGQNCESKHRCTLTQSIASDAVDFYPVRDTPTGNNRESLNRDTVSREGNREGIIREGNRESVSRDGNRESVSRDGSRDSVSRDGNRDSLPNRESINVRESGPTIIQNTNLSIESFLPKKFGRMESNTEDFNSTKIIEELNKSHSNMCSILHGRVSDLRFIRGMWSKGEIKQCFESLSDVRDQAVVVDVINAITDKLNSVVTLDTCPHLLLILKDLLDSPHQDHQITSMKAMQSLITLFGPIIRSTLSAPPSTGVDLSREERLEKCSWVKEVLLKTKVGLEAIASSTISGKAGQMAREMLSLLRPYIG